MVVEGDPDLVLVGEGRELLGHWLRTLQSDASAAQRLGHLEVEVDRLIRLAKADLMNVDVDACIIVHFPQLRALGQLRPVLLVGRLCRLLAGTPPTAASHAGI